MTPRSLLDGALKCACGNRLITSYTEQYEGLSEITGVPVRVYGAECLKCNKCGHQIISDDMQNELIEVLMISMSMSWRRLYPADVIFIRSQLKMNVADFEEAIGIEYKDSSINGFPEGKTCRLERDAVYIKDIHSEQIQLLAHGFLSEERRASLLSKWSVGTVVSGQHQLTAKKFRLKTTDEVKSMVAELSGTIEKLKTQAEQWLQYWTSHCIKSGWNNAVMIDSIGEPGIELAKILYDNNEISLWIMVNGGYASIDRTSSQKLTIDGAIEKMIHGEYKWIRPF